MLIESIFGKAINELLLSDIEMYFASPQTESDKIEFKSGKEVELVNGILKETKQKGVSKKIIATICAFLNTDGGIIIWGSPEGKKIDSKEKIFSGPLIPVSLRFEKDQFISIVTSSISPIPNRINFHSISIDSNNHVYILEVFKSEHPPHQYSGTYYMRLDGQTRTAPHQYVEALMKKITIPKLEMRFDFSGLIHRREVSALPFTITIKNTSRFQHDKNVRLILGANCNLLKEGQLLTELSDTTSLHVPSQEIIYYGAHSFHSFLLVFGSPKYSREQTLKLSATVSGDMCPVVLTRYDINVLYSSKIDHTIILKQENTFIWDSIYSSVTSDERGKNHLTEFVHSLNGGAVLQSLTDFKDRI